ncbi:MAG TPA: GlsB/YeaQ/YmgE family stress response membrane protein [Allosphingosinicella sp.]|nr:GlsB/YeaQ/YmgE family stress response membrane protein [Allosphingosinicella sp.]
MDLLANHNWLWWIIIGGIAGLIAKAIMPGRDPGGCIVTIILGIAGAVLAGFLGRMIGWYDQGDRGASFIAAIVGAIIILAIYRLVAGRRDRM